MKDLSSMTKLKLLTLRPPADVLLGWMRRVGIAGDIKVAEDLSWQIAIAIYKKHQRG